MPYGPHKLSTSDQAGMPVAADHNPWIDGARWKASDFSRFRSDGSIQQQKAGNAVAHWLDGQNVLFLDSHVEFAKRTYCGLDDDNIYTISSSQTAGDPLGTPPRLGSQPANRKDSLLVNDQPSIPDDKKR
jgi:prepilin-type processing-associated H-X9-DG protein